ncbi:MAG: SPOR domain-containing protein [Bacteroidales bacterium]|nr:SPOR domain-containing protein [Bacteroidales bacterium]
MYIIFFLQFIAYNTIAQGDIFVDIVLPSKLEAGKSYPIDIIIHKENISGFAKLELYMPVGVELNPIDNAGATLIKQGQLLKYIWIELPPVKDIKITANIVIDFRIVGYKEIYGNFFFIQDKNKSKVSIGIIPFQIKNDMSWKNNPAYKETQEYPKTDEVVKVKPQKISEPNFYRVQIAAFKRKLSKAQLSELYPDVEFIKEEFIDGLYKYTIGDFATLDDAKNFRSSCGIFGAFVVKYENYQRVVQTSTW